MLLLLLHNGQVDLSTFTARLRWAMDKAKKTNMSALAREIGVTPQSIQYLCDPKNNANGSEHVTKLGAALNVNADWLATGEGNPDRQDDGRIRAPSEAKPASPTKTTAASASDFMKYLDQHYPSDDNGIGYPGLSEFDDGLGPDLTGKKAIRSIPVVGHAQLGDNGHFYDLDHPTGFGDGVIDWPSRDENAYALKCRGDSMKPRIKHGEFVIVEPNHRVLPGDEVLVKAKDGRVMVKQLAYIRDSLIYLDSVNEAHPRISIAREDVQSISYIAGFAKSGQVY
jgi:phage repressor protein C with HTH and peptisase S24 domain